ncbi:MAG: hypothetical protein GOMPHAMPRED_001828 [Gomphillus americanus]|uniref:ATP-grasp domain-containing protein n=1 Tax=Gomphillus americanus TaxID=1940652 RepID=A0A8H3IL86_9LECA|nr:MAG: hypothetical protein GOMPHAMPRED_001828 [Gomphillus americanus]
MAQSSLLPGKMNSIKLVDTLAEFFGAEEVKVTLLSVKHITNRRLTSSIASNRQYMIQQWREPDPVGFSAMANLILWPQKMAWIAGHMPVIFLKTDEQVALHFRSLPDSVAADLSHTLSQLNPQDRWITQFCTDWEDVLHAMHDTKLLPILPCEQTISIPHLFDPQLHYNLLSKRCLALSGLPTPRAHTIDFAPPGDGWNDLSLIQAIDECIHSIHIRKVPFVVKSNFTMGSDGVYIVKSLEEQAAVELSVKQHLQCDLPHLQPKNASLRPLSILLTDYFEGDTLCVNFFVERSGQARFSSCVQQISTVDNNWCGSRIDYCRQDEHALTFNDTLSLTAKYLHKQGYFGPAGIDVMVNQAGTQVVVDLNVRPTGSFMLGCLRSHLYGLLELKVAEILPIIRIPGTRATFEASFHEDLKNGRLIIIAWYSDTQNECSYVHFVAAGKDCVILDNLISKLKM